MRNHLPFVTATVLGLMLSGCGRKDQHSTDADIELEAATPAATPVHEASVEREMSHPLSAATAPAEFKGYEAWFERYGLNLSDPAMLGADSDGDGYSNRDEFLVDTNPVDSKSHPGFHPVFRLREFKAVEIPIVLEKVDGKKATLLNQETGKKETVNPGDVIPGTVYKVKRVVAQIESDKFGQTTDVSRVSAENTETGELLSFIKGMPPRSPDSFAVLTSARDAGVSVKIKQGEEFAWPGEPAGRFRVMDLRPDQVVLKQLDTGDVWTVPMEHPKP